MEIYLLDRNFQLVSMPIEDFSSFTWVESWIEPGSFKLYLNFKYFPEIAKSRYIYNTEAGKGAIIETVSYTAAEERTVQIGGRLFESLLARRTAEKSWRTSGTIEEQAHKTFIRFAEPGTERELENVTDGALKGYEETGSISIQTGQTLSDWAYASLNAYGMSPEILYDFEAEKAVFSVRKQADRTQGNEGGFSPVLLSQSFENTKNDRYAYDETKLQNHAYVVMEDDPCYGRVTVEVSSRTAEEPRVELYVKSKASSEPDQSGDALIPTVSLEECQATMEQEGREALADCAILESVSCEMETNGIYEYRKDYRAGDIVTYASSILGVEMSAQIEKVTEIYEKGGKTVHAQIGKDFSAVNYLRRLINQSRTK